MKDIIICNHQIVKIIYLFTVCLISRYLLNFSLQAASLELNKLIHNNCEGIKKHS
jgi:hypothetical protein